MTSTGNMNEVIKHMIKNSLDSYNKVIPNSNLRIEDLIQKTEEINAKMNPNKPKEKNSNSGIGEENSSIEQQSKLKKQTNQIQIHFDSFRTENRFIPKLRINDIQEKLTDRRKDNPTYQGIMSLTSTKCSRPLVNSFNNINERDFNLRNGRNKPSSNNKHNYKLDPLFFTNQYIEYIYNDEIEKVYEESDIMRNAFENNMKQFSNQSLSLLNKQNSSYFKSYEAILKREQQIIEAESIEQSIGYQNGNKEIRKHEDEKDLKYRARQNSSVLNEVVALDTFKTFYHNHIKQYKDKKEEIAKNLMAVPEKSSDKTSQNANKEVTFGYCIENGLICYEDDNTTNTYANVNVNANSIANANELPLLSSNIKAKEARYQAIQLMGPMLTFFKRNERTKIEATLDLRNSEKEIDTLIIKPIPHKLNGKISLTVNDKEIVLSSLLLFKQIASFFNSFKHNIGNNTFDVLKYITNPNITQLEIPTNDFFSSVHWHSNLKSITLRYDFISKLSEALDKTSPLVNLESLIIYKSSLSDGSYDQPELNELFSKESTAYIRNISFIGIKYTETIHYALVRHIDTFYNMKDNKHINDSIPILNLTIKRSKESNEQGGSDQSDKINLIMLYCLFIKMFYYMAKNEKLFPIAFQKLDLSEQIFLNPEGLVKIITKFKMIKEIDISNSKLDSNTYIIDSPDFLPKIKLSQSKENQNILFSNDELAVLLDTEIEMLEKMNFPPIQSNEDLTYDLACGIYPILERIIFDSSNTPKETIVHLCSLFKKLKFFQGFSYPKFKEKATDNRANIIKEEFGDFCENFFQFAQDF